MSGNAVEQKHPNEQELIRWGDQQFIVAPVTEINPPKTIQLLKVHRQIPESWTVTLYLQLQNTPAVGPTFDVTAFFDFIIGSGSAQINLFPTIRCFAGAGPTQIEQDFNSLVTIKPVGFLTFTVPARDIQVICTNVINNSSPDQPCTVAALSGPRYTPPMPGPQGGPHPHEPHAWMGPGFHPEPLSYK